MKKIIAGILVAGITVSSLVGCESWERQKKDMASEYGGGLQRTVTVYAENGQVIREYKGKFDIEKKDGRLKFIDEKGKVHIVYLGNSATVVSDEE